MRLLKLLEHGNLAFKLEMTIPLKFVFSILISAGWDEVLLDLVNKVLNFIVETLSIIILKSFQSHTFLKFGSLHSSNLFVRREIGLSPITIAKNWSYQYFPKYLRK